MIDSGLLNSMSWSSLSPRLYSLSSLKPLKHSNMAARKSEGHACLTFHRSNPAHQCCFSLRSYLLILNLIVISPAAVLSCLAMTPPTPGLWKAVSSFFVSPCLRSNEIQLSFTMICEVANGVDICSVNSEDRPFLFSPLWN